MSSADSDSRCQYKNKRGQRCRMSRAALHDSLCSHHAGFDLKQREHRQPRQKLSAELIGPLDSLSSSAAVNYSLSKLLMLIADRRISPREASVMGYVYQLLLQSTVGVAKERHLAQNWRQTADQLTRIFQSIPRVQQERAEAARRAPSFDATGAAR